jgi:catechol 2,3-dioxygenase
MTAVPPVLAPSLRLAAVHLTVSDLERSVSFYETVLGLRRHRRDGAEASLGAGEDDLLLLREERGARPPGRHAGLFHFAVLVPSREELARSLRRLLETRTAIQGASDHLVSEALYLPDPDGLGIEIYADRPREAWSFDGGELRMDTLPLDLDDLLALAPEADGPVAPGTVVGHVHLHVSRLEPALAFYRDVVGLEVMTHFGSSAAFLSAGGYHHHLGINTWRGVGVPPAPEDVAGLRHWTVLLPGPEELAALRARLEAAAPEATDALEDSVITRDPAGNRVLFAVEAG